MSHRIHHYVPKFLLEQWCTQSDGKLSQFHWMRGRMLHERYAAKSVAKEEHLYSSGRDFLEPDVKIERDFLGPYVDEPASTIHKMIVGCGVRSLKTEDKVVWARFIVSLMLRVPAMMGHMRARGRAVLESGLDEDPDGFLNARGDAPETNLKEWVQKHRPWEFDDLAVSTLPHLVGSKLLNGALLRSLWATRPLAKTKIDLVIGDKPLVYVGTMETSFLVALPVSPRKVFFAFDNRNTWDNVARQSETYVAREMNRVTAGQADRYVYSTGRQHEPLLRKYLRKPR